MFDYLKVTNSTFLCSLALGLNGRPPRPIGALGSSKIYRVSGDTVLCYPLIFSGEYCFLFLSSLLQEINYYKIVILSIFSSFLPFVGHFRIQNRKNIYIEIQYFIFNKKMYLAQLQ